VKGAIGIFDSGVGGLTVVKELIRYLPQEDIVYFGDTAHVPYGTKSEETVIRFSLENIFFLLKCKVKLIVIACNTSSSIALPAIRKHFRLPIIGVISPGVKEAVGVTKNKRIGVIGTRATIRSGAYERYIRRLNPKIKVFSCACPLFVPLAEEGFLTDKVTFDIARKYLSYFKRRNIDTLILGCTHYPLFKSVISKVMGSSVTLVDSARQVARQAKEILVKEGLFSQSRRTGARRMFYVTDEPEEFSSLAGRFLGSKITNVKKVRI